MRHRVKGRKLGRTASHRNATLRSLATALLRHKKITTTLAKAKELRTFVEPLMTRAKVDSVAARRFVAREIKDKEVVKELFGEIAEKIRERNGGYTRIVKLGKRVGDAAELAIIELVDYNEFESEKPKKVTKKKKEKVKEEEKVETFEEAAVEEANVIEETADEQNKTETEETKEETAVAEESTEEIKTVEKEAEETSDEKVETTEEKPEKDEPETEATESEEEKPKDKDTEENKPEEEKK
jgi:large subunit ribosomal protein L17